MGSRSRKSSLAPRPTWEDVLKAADTFLVKSIRQLGVEEADVEDVVQDVLMAAFRGLDSFDPARFSRAPPLSVLEGMEGLRAQTSESPLVAWLLGITWRLVNHYREKAYRRREIASGVPGDATFPRIEVRPGFEDAAIDEERGRVIDGLLAQMDTGRRVVVVMHDLLGQSIAGIARDLGLNPHTTQNRLRLGREDLRAAIKRLPPEQRSALRFGDRPFAGEATTKARAAKPARSKSSKTTTKPRAAKPARSKRSKKR